jgi:hypothetical protein
LHSEECRCVPETPADRHPGCLMISPTRRICPRQCQ